MRKRCGLARHRSNGHCKVQSPNHRVKCDYSVQRIVTSTSNLTASKHVYIRGGRCHVFRLRLPSCSKIFESGSGNSSNLRIRLSVQTSVAIIHLTGIYPCFFLTNDHTNSCSCRNGKVTPVRFQFFTIFWLRFPIRFRKKNAESCRSRLWLSGSGPTSGIYQIWTDLGFSNPNPIRYFNSKSVSKSENRPF